MSASMRPTLLPSLANATAKFTAIVDFPTPPLPEAIAITPLDYSVIIIPQLS